MTKSYLRFDAADVHYKVKFFFSFAVKSFNTMNCLMPQFIITVSRIHNTDRYTNLPDSSANSITDRSSYIKVSKWKDEYLKETDQNR